MRNVHQINNERQRKIAKIQHKRRLEDALNYVKRVKEVFKAKPRCYFKFLDVMKDFKLHVIDTKGCIEKVKELFQGHDGLILGFSTFLPPGYDAPPDSIFKSKIDRQFKNVVAEKFQNMTHEKTKRDGGEKKKVEGKKIVPDMNFDSAVGYVSKVKRRFTRDPEVYRQFVEILHSYQQGKVTVKIIYDNVRRLLSGHEDLFTEFAEFLPRKRIEKERVFADREISVRHVTKEEVKMKLNSFYMRLRKMVDTSTYFEFIQNAKRLIERKLKKQEFIEQSAVILGDDSELKNLFRVLMHTRNFPLFCVPAERHLLDHERFGPSYRPAPEDVPDRNMFVEIDGPLMTLNNKLLCVPAFTSNENKKSKKSETDLEVFEVEEEQTFADIKLSTITSIIEHFQKFFFEEVKKDPKYRYKLKELKKLYQIKIKNFYGKRGKQVLDMLQKYPNRIIPIIQNRLKEKALVLSSLRNSQSNKTDESLTRNYYEFLAEERNKFRKVDIRKMLIENVLYNKAHYFRYSNFEYMSFRNKKLHNLMYHILLLSKKFEKPKWKLKNLKSFYSLFVIPFFELQKKQEKMEDDIFLKDQSLTPRRSRRKTIKKTSYAEDEVIAQPQFGPIQTVPPKSKPEVVPLKVNDQVQKKVDQEPKKVDPEEAFTRIHEQEVRNKRYNVFYGNNQFYVFIKLYAMLYKRLGICKRSCERRKKILAERESNEMQDEGQEGKKNTNNVESPFKHLIHLCFEKLNGKLNHDKFLKDVFMCVENECYEVITLAELISTFINQIHKFIIDFGNDKVTKTSRNFSEVYVKTFNYEYNRVNAFMDDSYLKMLNFSVPLRDGSIIRTLRAQSVSTLRDVQLHHEKQQRLLSERLQKHQPYQSQSGVIDDLSMCTNEFVCFKYNIHTRKLRIETIERTLFYVKLTEIEKRSLAYVNALLSSPKSEKSFNKIDMSKIVNPNAKVKVKIPNDDAQIIFLKNSKERVENQKKNKQAVLGDSAVPRRKRKKKTSFLDGKKIQKEDRVEEIVDNNIEYKVCMITNKFVSIDINEDNFFRGKRRSGVGIDMKKKKEKFSKVLNERFQMLVGDKKTDELEKKKREAELLRNQKLMEERQRKEMERIRIERERIQVQQRKYIEEQARKNALLHQKSKVIVGKPTVKMVRTIPKVTKRREHPKPKPIPFTQNVKKKPNSGV